MCGSKFFVGGRFFGFSTCGCFLGHDFYHFGCPKPTIWQAHCLHFLTLRTILPAWGHPRGPWKDTWGPRTRFLVILADFGWFWEPVLRAFWPPMGWILCFFWVCFQVTVCIDFWVELLTVGALKTRFSHGRYCKKQVSAKKVYWWFEGRFLVFFGGLGITFSEFVCFGNRLENWAFFQVILGILIGSRK